MKDKSLTSEQKKKFEDSWNQSSVLTHLNARLELGDDVVRVVLDKIQPFHQGGVGTSAVNGGVAAYIIDIAFGAIGALQSRDTQAASLNLNIKFLNKMIGDKLICSARILKKGTKIIFAKAEIHNDKNVLCAEADSTLILLEKKN